MMSLSGVPSVSAAICASTVSEPVPRSVPPTSTLKLPSSFILMLAAPMSSPGMAVPCMQTAMPNPRRMWGRCGSTRHCGSSLRSQAIAAAPWLTHCSSPQLCTTCGWRLLSPSPNAAVIGTGSPERTAFLSRNSTASKPNASAISSIRLSSANSAWGAP